MERTTGITTVIDAEIEKGHVLTITGPGYTVYASYTRTPEGNDSSYLGRSHSYREAEYEVIRAYAHDRKAL